MATFLFDKLIFGPVSSRRLGVSLGVNLLPLQFKLCNFNCVYCECGLTEPKRAGGRALPTRAEVKSELERVLLSMKAENKELNTITFAGNGEPTMHPEFCDIVDDTLALRDAHMPSCKVSVLSNATLIDNPRIVSALLKVDNRILKLDAGTESSFRAINQPLGSRSMSDTIASLKTFQGQLTIQTLFVRGGTAEAPVDNTTEAEVSRWLELLKEIRPQLVMIYPIERDTPVAQLQKLGREELERIGERVRALGLTVEVYG